MDIMKPWLTEWEARLAETQDPRSCLCLTPSMLDCKRPLESQQLGLAAPPGPCQGEEQVGPCSQSPGKYKDYLSGMLLDPEVLGSFSSEKRGLRGNKGTVTNMSEKQVSRGEGRSPATCLQDLGLSEENSDLG